MGKRNDSERRKNRGIGVLKDLERIRRISWQYLST